MAKTQPIPKRWYRLKWARRITQGLFLFLFLFLIFATRAVIGSGVSEKAAGEVAYPVEAFLDIDPLIALVTVLSTGVIPGAMIFSLIVFASAVFLGRGFCGWVCPLGTLNHLFSEVGKKTTAKKRIDQNKTKPYQKVKYIVLIGVLVTALFGSAAGGLLDPISLVTRGITVTLLPWINWILSGLLSFLGASNNNFLQHVGDSLSDGLNGTLVHTGGYLFSGGIVISIIFLAVLVSNRFMPRFWCRGICPLGALLGVSGALGFITLKKDSHNCNNCGHCQRDCSGGANPIPKEKWHRAECDLCMNCVAVCKKDALSFQLAKEPLLGLKNEEVALPDLSRRQLIVSAAASAAIVPTVRTGSVSSTEGRPDPSCIRPPGAVHEAEFLKRCIRCGQCMKICPSNALHPALDEAGLEGLWTPVLVPKQGYCEPTCTLCTQVCPTAAIKTVSPQTKIGKKPDNLLRIGTAFINRGRCLPWAMGTPCTVCEEFCPVAQKAIWLEEITVPVAGKTVVLKRPYVDPQKCTGCGACEHVCPVHDKAAIVVSSAGETRSKKNTLLLKS